MDQSLPGGLPYCPTPPTVRRGPRLPAGWALYLLFGGLGVWWFLGLSGVVQAAFAVPMLITLAVRGQVQMPRIFLAWLVFLGWMFASGTQATDFNSIVSFAWRASIYVGSTIIFFYVFNTSRETLPARKIVNMMGVFWVLAVVGGLLGMLYPNHTFTSLLAKLLPQHVLANAFVKALVIPGTTGGKAFPGLGIYRVKAPFIYTNQWGSAYALTLPFALGTLRTLRSKLWKFLMIGLLIISIAPLVFSLDRGSWISTGLGTTYALLRLAGSRNPKMARFARALLALGVVIAAILLLSPLGSIALTRANNGYGDQHRAVLYQSSIELVKRSPILGYSGPVALSVLEPNAPPGPSIGTHGQFWTIMVSNGIPALIFFVGWFALAFFKTGRRVPASTGRDVDARFWCHVAVFTALVQMPYYELLPWGLPIAMVATAVALRETRGLPLRFGRPGMLAATTRTRAYAT